MIYCTGILDDAKAMQGERWENESVRYIICAIHD